MAETRNASAAREGRRKKLNYNVRLIRSGLSYTVHEIAELYKLHPNAIRRWLTVGLCTIDDRRPQLVHGSDLIEFLRARRGKRARKCAGDQMYCCRCRVPRRPRGLSVTYQTLNARQVMVRGVCEACGARMNRGGSLAALNAILRGFAEAAPASLEATADPAVQCDFSGGGTQ